MSSKSSKPKLIGVSLSFCVTHLVKRKIPYYRVRKLITGTAAEGDEGWQELLEMYAKVYWSEWPEQVKHRERATDEKLRQRAVSIANRLRAEGKIEQPRLVNGLAPRWRGREDLWVQHESDIQYWKPGE